MTEPASGEAGDSQRKIGSLPQSEAEILEANPTLEDQSSKEALQLSRGLPASDLEKEAAAREHARSQKFRDNFEIIAIIGLWAVFLALLSAAGIWLWHLLTPERCHWLSVAQLATVQNIVTGGIIAAAIGDHFKRRLA